MKKYEKPVLMAVSVSGNDQLCGSCADAAAKGGFIPHLLNKEPTSALSKTIDEMVGNADGTLTRDEAIRAFAPGENCEDDSITIYCKFTSTGEKVAWS